MKFKDVAHLYLGCECSVSSSDYYEAGIGKLVRIDIEDGELATISGTQYCVEADFCDIKPTLRQLSSMTDDEFKEVVYLFFWQDKELIAAQYAKIERYTYSNKESNTSIPYKCFDHMGNTIRAATISDRLNPKQFAYCLSIGIDLFGLIQSGEAIDATTIK